MFKIEFLEEITENGKYINLYAVINGLKRFVYHINSNNTYFYYGGHKYSDNSSMLNAIKDNIIKHKGKYFSLEGDYDDPFEFLHWLKENRVEETLDFEFEKSKNGDYTIFYGGYNGDFEDEEMEFNDFAYLIYDEKMLNELQTVIDIMFGFKTND